MKRLADGRRRVVVAMSGGVDSSTVAGLLAEQGHEVIGLTMKLYDRGDLEGSEGTCCSLDDVADARRVAEHLGIPFFVGNYEKVFRKAVVDDFVDAYLQGQTPNPCVRCNDVVKFRSLLARSRALGGDLLATGHYASTEVDDAGAVTLWQGVDDSKDQTYFLAGIAPESLARVVFPLGALTKTEVRQHAERLGLPVAAKAESQDICFVPDGDYASFVERQAGERGLPGPGEILSVEGLRIGQHRGVHRYTVGQRRGLGVSGPERRYVVELDAERNQVVLGGRSDVMARGLVAHNLRWIGAPPTEDEPVTIRIRHNHSGVQARVLVGGETMRVEFDEPVLAVSPGQQVAVYRGRHVLGAATIIESLAAVSREVAAHV